MRENRSHLVRAALRAAACVAGSTWALSAQAQSAQEPPANPTGAPPPDASAIVSAYKPSEAPPAVPDKPVSGTTISLSAGGNLQTGNSRALALSANGKLESRWNNDGLGISILGNYGQGAAPGDAIVETAGNIQGRVRYDRYLIQPLSLFLIQTGRNDRFEGLDLRYNLDPGVKYLFLTAATNTLWIEAGYDFQYEVRRTDSLAPLDSTGAPIPGAPPLPRTDVNHSVRLYAGFQHSFNKEVTLQTGVEYIQSFTDTSHRWLNYEALFAAKIWGGLALGVGFNLRYDDQPLPGKLQTDTSTTLSLIYAFSDIAPPPKPPIPPPVCVPPPPPPPPPPGANTPAPATIPPPAAPTTMDLPPTPPSAPPAPPPPPAPTP